MSNSMESVFKTVLSSFCILIRSGHLRNPGHKKTCLPLLLSTCWTALVCHKWRINNAHPTRSPAIIMRDDNARHPLCQVPVNIYAQKKGLEARHCYAPFHVLSLQLQCRLKEVNHPVWLSQFPNASGTAMGVGIPEASVAFHLWMPAAADSKADAWGPGT